jgi:DNA-binding transcriptional ArsR family regulator
MSGWEENPAESTGTREPEEIAVWRGLADPRQGCQLSKVAAGVIFTVTAALLGLSGTGHFMNQKITATGCADRLKALADPDRLRIVTALRTGPMSVGELAERLPMELANVSHHLGVLRTSQIVLSEKQGRRRVYRLNPEIAPDPEATKLEFGCCRLELDTTWNPKDARSEKK